MKVVYYAMDGTPFDNADACERYEKSLLLSGMPKMYDSLGKETDEVENAEIVIMESKANYKAFIEACNKFGNVGYDGIDPYDFMGDRAVYYLWYGYEDRFIVVTETLLDAIKTTADIMKLNPRYENCSEA